MLSPTNSRRHTLSERPAHDFNDNRTFKEVLARLVSTESSLGEASSAELQRLWAMARPSLIPSLCTHYTRAGIEWRR